MCVPGLLEVAPVTGWWAIFASPGTPAYRRLAWPRAI